MAKFSTVLSLLAVILLAACSAAPFKESLPTIADRLVAKDFAQLLVQVDAISPENTALRMADRFDSSDTFDIALREELLIVGYEIEPITFELVSDVPAIGHNAVRTPAENGVSVVYTVNVGEVIFRRGYIINSDGLVQPKTAMEAKGIDAGTLSQDDSIFELNDDAAAVTAAAPTQSSDTDLVEASLPAPIEEELIVIPRVVDASSAEAGEDLLLNASIIGESLLTFDGDSLVMGESNKRRVRNLISNFEPKTDMFSVLGCVFQDEGSWTEDASQLAFDRSQRVQSELLYAGIPEMKIRAEACAQDVDSGAPIIPVGSVLLLLNRVR